MFVNGVQNDEFEKHEEDELCIRILFSLSETKLLTLHIRFRSKLRSAVIEETWNRVRVRGGWGGGLNFWGKRVFLNIITETESNYECKRKHYMNHSISRGVFLEALNGWFFLEYWLKICWILANREYEEYGKSAFSGRPFDGQVGQTEELFQQCLSTWFNVPTFHQCLSAL